MAILLILPLFSMNAFGASSIELKSYSTTIDQRGTILVIGKATGLTPHIPVQLTVTDPSGKLIYSPSVPFDGDGNFKYHIQPTLPQFSTGTYTVKATHRDLAQPVQLQFQVYPVGTTIVPEFGPIVMVILVMSVAGIVIMTGRYKVLGFQKF